MPDQEQQTKDLRIPLHVEEISVSRCEIKKATVPGRSGYGTREQLIDEELTQVRVEIERVPIDRAVDVVPPIRQEGDITIIPVVEEIVVVERRLVLRYIPSQVLNLNPNTFVCFNTLPCVPVAGTFFPGRRLLEAGLAEPL